MARKKSTKKTKSAKKGAARQKAARTSSRKKGRKKSRKKGSSKKRSVARAYKRSLKRGRMPRKTHPIALAYKRGFMGRPISSTGIAEAYAKTGFKGKRKRKGKRKGESIVTAEQIIRRARGSLAKGGRAHGIARRSVKAGSDIWTCIGVKRTGCGGGGTVLA